MININIYTNIIETDRLILRNIRPGDLMDFNEYARQEDVGPRAGWQPHKSMEESLGLLEKFMDKNLYYCLVLKETGKLIGAVELMDCTRQGYQGECEVGYVMSHDYWGKGYMSEAVKALQKLAFEIFHLDRLICGYIRPNRQSMRVGEKCNFTYLDTIKGFADYPGVEDKSDLILTSITRETYEGLAKK